MGRPRKFDRDEAIEAAMQAFWEDGYEASSVKALSERLGITRSSFYNTFGSRQNLFHEVLGLYASRSPDHLLATPPPGLKVRELLSLVFREACRARTADPGRRGCMVVNCAAELLGDDSEAGAEIANAIRASLSRFEKLIETGKAAGELPMGMDTAATALALQNLLVGINLMARVVDGFDRLWDSVRLSLHALGLLATPPPAAGRFLVRPDS